MRPCWHFSLRPSLPSCYRAITPTKCPPTKCPPIKFPLTKCLPTRKREHEAPSVSRVLFRRRHIGCSLRWPRLLQPMRSCPPPCPRICLRSSNDQELTLQPSLS